MATAAALRSRYAREAASTASPVRLLTMLYDRLVRDLVVAEAALAGGDLCSTSNELLHAQAIVVELRASLELDSWSGAQGLADLYDYLLTQLVAANVEKDAAKIGDCRAVVEPLRDAWHEAADSLHSAS
jgi:flagellar protein FliS